MKPPGKGEPRRRPPTAYDRIISGRLRSGQTPSYLNAKESQNQTVRPPHFLPPLHAKSEFNSISILDEETYSPLHLSYQPENMICPSCRRIIKTATVSSTSRVSILLTAGLCLLGCCLCACLPSFLDSLKYVRHSCPRCKVLIGAYDPDI